jgi:hypothetical protein
MKRGSTLFLRGAVLLLGLVVLALCLFALPAGLRSPHVGGYRPVLWGIYVTAVPFFVALYHGLKLLSYIDHGQAFAQASVNALKYIKYCAFVIGAVYAAGSPYLHMMAQRDDAPGVLMLGLIFAVVPLVIGAFAAVLQELLRKAIAMKSENELTV